VVMTGASNTMLAVFAAIVSHSSQRRRQNLNCEPESTKGILIAFQMKTTAVKQMINFKKCKIIQATNSDTEFRYIGKYKCTCTEHQARIHWYTCHCVDTGYWHMGNTTGPNTVQYMIGVNHCIRTQLLVVCWLKVII
jgi:hypothetical protein